MAFRQPVPIPEDLQKAWDDAKSLMTEKNDPQAALEKLRAAWDIIESDNQKAKTLALAADAGTELGVIDPDNQKSHWQKAYRNYNESMAIDPKNKDIRRNMNKLASMMDEKSISLGLGFQMFDQGNPTPLGLMTMVLSLVASLVAIKLVSDFLDNSDNPIVIMEVQYSVNGLPVTADIQIEMYEDEAPMHVDSFLTHVRNFQYDGVKFHRVIEGFMIQGGDFERGDGTGGYAANYYGWCNGQERPQSECSQKEDWTIPYEHENGLRHTPGALAAAHAGLNTDGSQFYIVPEEGEASHLDWEAGKDCSASSCHTVFGYVIDGIEHVTAISETDTDGGNKPTSDVIILSARVV
tara:strand:- start:418 stop:1470 length:1053 start_codon:yes stop_codon:yes gene_type:complete